MSRIKYYNGSAWVVVETDASKVNLVDVGSKITSSNVEDALQEIVTSQSTYLADSLTRFGIAQRDILRIKMRQTGLNLDPNAWSDTLEDATGINAGASSGYTLSGGKLTVTPVGYTADLCTGGTAISGGASGSDTADKVFDNSGSTYFISTQSGAGVNGVAYIGYQFASTKRIRKFTIAMSGTASYQVTSCKLQYSDNGSSWSDEGTHTLNTGLGGVAETFLVADNGSHVYWRLLANSATGGTGWMVIEVEMMESSGGGTTAIIIWNAIASDGTLTKALIESVATIGTGTIIYEISRDNGVTFTTCTLDTVTSISAQPSGTNIVLKVTITGNAELFAIAFGGVA